MDKMIIIILIILGIVAICLIIYFIKESVKKRKAKEEYERVKRKLDALERLGVPAYSWLFFLDEEDK